MYRNATEFYTLIFYLATLWNLLVLTGFFVESLGVSTYRIISLMNRDNFTPFFPTWMFTISLHCLTTLARPSNIMLNKSRESKHPCFVSNLREKLLVFHHWVWRQLYVSVNTIPGPWDRDPNWRQTFNWLRQPGIPGIQLFIIFSYNFFHFCDIGCNVSTFISDFCYLNLLSFSLLI